MEPGPATVVDLLAEATATHPEATAVVAADGSLTYAELDGRAAGLASRLAALGVGPGTPVGVGLDRCTGLSVALVGVLQAGGACLPLDPAFPPSRLRGMVQAAGPAAAIVTRAGLADRFRSDVPVLLVDEAAGDAPAALPARVGPNDVAYVIFTSGSTGVPNGVLLTHGGLVSHHRAVVDLYGLGPGDRVLQFCSLGFDASIEEMFPTWAAGATVVHRPEDVPLLGPDWLEWLRDRRITVLNLPTAYWHAWVRDLDSMGARVPDDVRLVVVGGEPALGPVYRTWRRVGGDRVRWVNAYGPTETTCMSTFYEPPLDGEVDAGDGWDPPIGRPLPGTTLRVVDEALRPVPAGVTGELLIGGPGLARGYIGDPDLTARRFVDGPPRMYRTGDLVCELPGGDLAYVGRVDGQVKIQGFRVECGEVEAALARHPAVAACAVVARDEPPGERRLVAFVVARAPVAERELRRFLADRLPAHMVPSAVAFVDALPLTEHGKVDRAALPRPAPAGPGAGAGAGGRSIAEDRMAGIWAAVLGMPQGAIGPSDDFFDLGGHSLLATQVVARIREEFGTATPLRVMFESPTLGQLAAAVEAEAGGAGHGPPLAPAPRSPGARFPLSLAQEQMWALERRAEPAGLYNFTVLHRFESSVDPAELRRALGAVAARHEIIRTAIEVDEAGVPYQVVVEGAEVDLAVVEVADEVDLEARIAAHEAVPFDLARPPLVRAALFRRGPRDTLAVTFDHVIADGTGAGIFMRELLAAYAGEPLPPAPTVQFADVAAWQRAAVGEDAIRRQLDWWAGYLGGAPLGPAVPFDRVPATPTRRIRSTALAVAPPVRVRLEQLARATGSTLFAVVVAAVSALLGRAGDIEDVVLSTTVSGRTRPELEGLVGMFSGMSRIRCDLSGDPPFEDVVARARDVLLGIFDHQDVPFMRVRRAIYPDFPSGGPAVAAALPIDLQYFHTGGHPPQEFFFRGQLHPLALTLLDDGDALTGDVSYKVDFYEAGTVDRLVADFGRLVAAVARTPGLRLSQLPVSGPAPR